MITWNDLFTQGTLIDFSIHLWRARIRLTAEDLGIDSTEDVQKAISFGCHRLAPASAFETINAIIHAWERDIFDHSLAFPILEGVRYVPDDQVKVLQTKLDMHLRDFEIEVAAFLETYEAMIQEQLPVIEKALAGAAKTPESAAAALSRIISEYPSRQRVAEKFGLEWNFFTISVPASKAAAQTAKSAVPQIQKVVSGMVEQLRTELAGKVANLISLAKKSQDGTAQTKDGFGKRSKQSALDVLMKVDRLNFLDDATLREQTKILRSLLETDQSELNGVVRDLNRVQNALESDIATASAFAEKRLTGLGNRKLQF